MLNSVSAPSELGRARDLREYQASLSVRLIATPRAKMVTCSPGETLASVRARVLDDGFDHVPVEHQGALTGILEMRKTDGAPGDRVVHQEAVPIGEHHLLGAESSILEFIEQAHLYPFRFVVETEGINGLVSLSDIQQLPVRASLFALVTQLEITMADVIRAYLPDQDAWLNKLSETRRGEVMDKVEAAMRDNSQVDSLLYTQFCDKRTLLEGLIGQGVIEESRRKFKKTFQAAEELRNKLAHANEISATAKTCQLVGELRRWIQTLESLVSSEPGSGSRERELALT